MKPLSRLLIANRGEIVVRIARTARRMGIATIAICSDADRDAPHVAACDEFVAIGGNLPAESYLLGERIIAAAQALLSGPWPTVREPPPAVPPNNWQARPPRSTRSPRAAG